MTLDKNMTCDLCGCGERHLTRVVQQQDPQETEWLCDACLEQWKLAHSDTAPIPLESADEDMQRAYSIPKTSPSKTMEESQEPKRINILTPAQFTKEAIAGHMQPLPEEDEEASEKDEKEEKE